MTRAVYAGTFDPLTNGHLHIVQQASSLFDELVVAIGVNPDKRTLFTVAERQSMISDALWGAGIDLSGIQVSSFENRYLVDFAKELAATHIVRGVRNAQDFAFEQAMRNVNHDLAPGVQTVFLMPDRSLCEVSSSFVKGLMGPRGWEEVVAQYVPAPVLQSLLAREARP